MPAESCVLRRKSKSPDRCPLFRDQMLVIVHVFVAIARRRGTLRAVAKTGLRVLEVRAAQTTHVCRATAAVRMRLAWSAMRNRPERTRNRMSRQKNRRKLQTEAATISRATVLPKASVKK